MLDFFKDLFAAFKQSSVERVRSPFIGAFAFSWLGFNWPVVAIVLFSKKDVIERIDYIKGNYDVGTFVLGPALISIVICIILPWANRIVIKLQSDPMTDSASMLLHAKIKLGRRQLKIADLEAKKNLAKKREEKKIEADIAAIEREMLETNNINKQLKDEVERLRNAHASESENVAKLTKTLTDLRIEFTGEKAAKAKLLDDIHEQSRTIEDFKYKESQWKKIDSGYSNDEKKMKKALEYKEREILTISSRCNEIVNNYPNIFQPDEAGVIMVRELADEKLKEINEEMFKRIYG